MSLRVARDGEAYSYQQFVDYYGHERGDSMWQSCHVAEVPEASASEAQDCGASQPADPPDAFIRSETEASDALQLAISETPFVLTYSHLRNLPGHAGCGGQQACMKQRELRQFCLEQNLRYVDLTDGSWDWKQLLKNQPAAITEELMGPGVKGFSFRLLDGVRDQNYVKPNDKGDKHVFQIDRVDGSCYHLHFHKNGSMDTPLRGSSQGNHVDMTPLGGASQPAAQPRYTLGKNEAHLKLKNLIDETGNAVVVTDEKDFQWNRFLQTQTCGAEILSPGTYILEVLALTWKGKPAVAFSRSDGETFIVVPSAMKTIPNYTQMSTMCFKDLTRQ